MSTLPESARTFWDGPYAGRDIRFASSSVQHGVAVFEGVRCYATADGPAVFRLREHMTRLLRSARLLGIDHGYRLEELCAKMVAAARASGLADCYLRPVLCTPDPYLTVDLTELRFTLAIEVWPSREPGDEAPGTRLTISHWRRPSPSSFPPSAKAVGMYVTSSIAKTEAVRAGWDEAIQLDPDSGRVAEATTANVFLVRDGQLVTPWLTDSLLPGITRDSVLTLARELGIPAREEPVETAELLAADEVFITGTACELVPAIRVEDRRYQAPGPVFGELLAAFRRAVSGRRFAHLDWLTPVP